MLLRELATDYYNHALNFDQYRQKRRAIFDQIDVHFNGVAANEASRDSDTQAYVSGVDGITGRVSGGEGDEAESKASDPFTLGGTQAFSLQEVLDAQDKKN